MWTRATVTLYNSKKEIVKKYFHHYDWYLSNLWYQLQFAIKASIDEFNYESIMNAINILDRWAYKEIAFNDICTDTEYNYHLLLAEWDLSKTLWDSYSFYDKPLSRLIIEKKWWEDVTNEEEIERFELELWQYTEYTREQLEDIDKEHMMP